VKNAWYLIYVSIFRELITNKKPEIFPGSLSKKLKMNQMGTNMLASDGLIGKLAEPIEKNSKIDTALFEKYNVKRGLRNADHTGVLVGLTRIGDVVGYRKDGNGGLQAIDGKLLYRGIDVEDLVKGFQTEERHGFELCQKYVAKHQLVMKLVKVDRKSVV
jgi:hypothetical protein